MSCPSEPPTNVPPHSISPTYSGRPPAMLLENQGTLMLQLFGLAS